MYFVFTGGIMREDSELITEDDYVLIPQRANHMLPDEYNSVVIKLTQYEPADRPKDMKEVIKMLNDLININQIHFDFEFFLGNVDTDEITGEKIKVDEKSSKPKVKDKNKPDPEAL